MQTPAVTLARLLSEAPHREMGIVSGVARFYSLPGPAFRTSSLAYKDNAPVAKEEGGPRRVKRREGVGFGVSLLTRRSFRCLFSVCSRHTGANLNNNKKLADTVKIDLTILITYSVNNQLNVLGFVCIET